MVVAREHALIASRAMARPLTRLAFLPIVAAALLGAGPAPARAEELYSFIDSDGVLHVTNVPEDPRYRRARSRGGAERSESTARAGAAARRAREPAATAVKPAPRVRRVTLTGRPARGAGHRSSAYEEHIRASAERNGLPVPLLEAVMSVESNFDPGAVSNKGATGLMQLMPGTARDMSVADVHDPAQNIEGGARYLKQLHARFGNDLVKVLAAYNAGPRAVNRSGGAVPAIPETQDYVRKVLARYERYLKGREGIGAGRP